MLVGSSSVGAENHQRLSFRPQPCRGRNLLVPLPFQTNSRSLPLLGMTYSVEVHRTSGPLYTNRENALTTELRKPNFQILNPKQIRNLKNQSLKLLPPLRKTPDRLEFVVWLIGIVLEFRRLGIRNSFPDRSKSDFIDTHSPFDFASLDCARDRQGRRGSDCAASPRIGLI